MTELKNNKLVKANCDPEKSQIRLLDSGAIFCRLEKVTSIPGQQFPNVTPYVKCFSIETFEAMEKLRFAKNPINWVTSGGFATCRVFHDGRLLTQEQRKELEDYKKEVFKPVIASESDLARLQAEVKQLKRKVRMT